MKQQKLITVGIPVYNGEKFIEETLRSVINQSYTNLEVIVSDNGSIDKTVEIVKKLMLEDSRIKLNVNEENRGFSGNLNKIIELASSEYVAIYHADDVYEPNIVEEQVKFLKNNEELAGCFTLGKMIDENGAEIKNKFIIKQNSKTTSIILNLSDFLMWMCSKGNIFICPTAMIKKSVYEKLKGYNTKINYIEDLDMWIRILEKFSLGILGKELIKYRIHSKQGSGYYSDISRETIAVDLLYMKNYLDENLEFKKKYSNMLRKRISKGYLVLGRNAVFLRKKEKYIDFIEKSKENYIFLKNPVLYLLQILNKNFTYSILIRIFKDKRKKNA